MGGTLEQARIENRLPETRITASRFRNPIGKYILRRNARCISCGLCAKLCPYGVHRRFKSFSQALRPLDYKCIGPNCRANDFYCVDNCPQKALVVKSNPILETIGDYRWSSEMILGHWYMAKPAPYLM